MPHRRSFRRLSPTTSVQSDLEVKICGNIIRIRMKKPRARKSYRTYCRKLAFPYRINTRPVIRTNIQKTVILFLSYPPQWVVLGRTGPRGNGGSSLGRDQKLGCGVVGSRRQAVFLCHCSVAVPSLICVELECCIGRASRDMHLQPCGLSRGYRLYPRIVAHKHLGRLIGRDLLALRSECDTCRRP